MRRFTVVWIERLIAPRREKNVRLCRQRDRGRRLLRALDLFTFT
jgi:hypothetical protein